MSNHTANRNALFSSGGGGGGGAGRGGARAAAGGAPPAARAPAARAPAARAAAPPDAASTVAKPPAIPPAIAERARKEAEENWQAGLKFTVKGKGFKPFWSADPTRAAPLFAKAANSFKAAGDNDMAVSMFVEASTCQIKTQAFASAAMNLGTAAKLAGSLGKSDEAISLWKQAASAWLSSMDSQRAAEYLVQAAKVAATASSADACAAQWADACDLIVARDTLELGGGACGSEILQQALNWSVSQQRLAEALELLPRYCVALKARDQPGTLFKAYLSQTVLELALGDVVRADRTYLEHLQDDRYLHADEAQLAGDLVQAFKQNDATLLDKTIRDHRLTFLDNPVTRVAKGLVLSSEFDFELDLGDIDSSDVLQSGATERADAAAPSEPVTVVSPPTACGVVVGAGDAARPGLREDAAPTPPPGDIADVAAPAASPSREPCDNTVPSASIPLEDAADSSPVVNTEEADDDDEIDLT